MKKIELKNLNIDIEEILYAHTTSEDYEMSRTIILEKEDGDKYIVLEGGHCSCYDEFFGHGSLEAMEYTRDEIKLLCTTTWKGTKEEEFLKEYFNIK